MIIYVYNGAGTSYFSTQYLSDALRSNLWRFGFDVRFINAQQIKEGHLLCPDKVKMLIIGGGGFSIVKETLGSHGLDNIKRYVHAGGQYAGICMGSYAAFTDISFSGIEKKQSAGLGFFNVQARGSIHDITSPFDGTAKSATIIEAHHHKYNITFPTLYWGGNAMDQTEINNIGATPLTSMTLPNGKETIVSAVTSVGSNGGRAFLSSYHFEAYNRMKIWNWTSRFTTTQEKETRQQLIAEIQNHPNGAYMMGLGCALDDMQLVPDHSFVKQFYPDISEPDASPIIMDTPAQQPCTALTLQ